MIRDPFDSFDEIRQGPDYVPERLLDPKPRKISRRTSKVYAAETAPAKIKEKEDLVLKELDDRRASNLSLADLLVGKKNYDLERLEKEKLEQERLEKEKLEEDNLERARREQEKLEQEKLEKDLHDQAEEENREQARRDYLRELQEHINFDQDITISEKEKLEKEPEVIDDEEPDTGDRIKEPKVIGDEEPDTVNRIKEPKVIDDEELDDEFQESMAKPYYDLEDELFPEPATELERELRLKEFIAANAALDREPALDTVDYVQKDAENEYGIILSVKDGVVELTDCQMCVLAKWLNLPIQTFTGWLNLEGKL